VKCNFSIIYPNLDELGLFTDQGPDSFGWVPNFMVGACHIYGRVRRQISLERVFGAACELQPSKKHTEP
jgi:hypothetical protein